MCDFEPSTAKKENIKSMPDGCHEKHRPRAWTAQQVAQSTLCEAGSLLPSWKIIWWGSRQESEGSASQEGQQWGHHHLTSRLCKMVEKIQEKKIAPTDGPQQAGLWEGHGLKQNHKAEDPTVLVPHGSKPKHLPRVGYLFRHTELRSELRITLNIKLHCPNIQLPEPVPTTLFLWQGLTV